jgi:hypothetical protein
MRKIVEVPLKRLQALPLHFSAASAVQVGEQSLAGAGKVGIWRCQLNLTDGVWAAAYAGPTPNDCWSFLAWRNVEVCGHPYREAIGQHTEDAHLRRGFGAVVLEAALQDAVPLFSDREGMTYPAFCLWRCRALDGGAGILDTETGEIAGVTTMNRDELWHDSAGCERHQLVFFRHVEVDALGLRRSTG